MVLALKAAVAFFIPDVPKWVELQMARQEHQARQARFKEVGIGSVLGLSPVFAVTFS